MKEAIFDIILDVNPKAKKLIMFFGILETGQQERMAGLQNIYMKRMGFI